MRLRAGISHVSPGDANVAGLGGPLGQLLVYRRSVCGTPTPRTEEPGAHEHDHVHEVAKSPAGLNH